MVDSTNKKHSEITIEYPHEKKIVVAGHSANLLDTLLRSKVAINTSCGGLGTCGTCRVFILEGEENLNPRNAIEDEMAKDRDLATHERLSCQCEISGDIRIRIPE